jgi:hypothetical protein
MSIPFQTPKLIANFLNTIMLPRAVRCLRFSLEDFRSLTPSTNEFHPLSETELFEKWLTFTQSQGLHLSYQDLLDYYTQAPSPIINSEQITQFFLRLFATECGGRVANLLFVITTRDPTNSLISSLICANFHELVYAHLPLGDSCLILSSLMLRSPEICQWVCSHEFNIFQKIANFLNPASPQIIPSLALFSMAPFDLNADATIALDMLAKLTLSESDPSVLKMCLLVCDQWIPISQSLNQQLFEDGRIFSSTVASDPEILPQFLQFLADHPLTESEQKERCINFLMESIRSGNDELIDPASLGLTKLILPDDVEMVLQSGIWDVLVEILEDNKRFTTKENVFQAICAILRNVNVDQAIAIVDNGFFRCLQAHLELITASPNESIEALFNLGYIAIYHGLREWKEQIVSDEFIEKIQEVRDTPGGTDLLIHMADLLLTWIS